jgi:hypothetical protein
MDMTLGVAPKWVTKPPLWNEEIVTAFKAALAQLVAGLGRAGPFGRSAPAELSDGYLSVVMTGTGGIFAHWEPADEDDMDAPSLH